MLMTKNSIGLDSYPIARIFGELLARAICNVRVNLEAT